MSLETNESEAKDTIVRLDINATFSDGPHHRAILVDKYQDGAVLLIAETIEGYINPITAMQICMPTEVTKRLIKELTKRIDGAEGGK